MGTNKQQWVDVANSVTRFNSSIARFQQLVLATQLRLGVPYGDLLHLKIPENDTRPLRKAS